MTRTGPDKPDYQKAGELAENGVFRLELLQVLQRIASSLDGIEELLEYEERRAEKRSRVE